MSDIDPMDLVCRARREQLRDDEEQRLQDLMQTSREARLMALILPEFERESQVQRGDDALVDRITARAIRKSKARLARPRPSTAWLLAAALLLVGTIAGAWRYQQAPRALETAPSSSASADSLASASGRKPARRLPRKGGGSSKSLDADAAPPLAPEATLAETSGLALEERQLPLEDPLSSAKSADVAPPLSKSHRASLSAATLFIRANLSRREGRTSDAMGGYRAILHDFPGSREAAPARLALAKLLSKSNPNQALLEYQKLGVEGGVLRAEALWGIAEVAEGLGQTATAQQALADLCKEFPDSPYAEVARRRMSDGKR